MKPHQPTFTQPLPGHNCRRGFTLAELLAVIAIMVLLMSFTIPAMMGSGSDIKKSAWDLASIVEDARTAAMAKNTYIWVCFHGGDYNMGSSEEGSEPEGVGAATNITAVTLSSRDGTSDFTPDNLQFLRFNLLENVVFYPVPPYSAPSKRITSSSDNTVILFHQQAKETVPFPDSLPPKVKALTSLRVLGFTPQGSVMLSGAKVNGIVELGLAPLKGQKLAEADNTAVIQVSGITGQSKIYQP